MTEDPGRGKHPGHLRAYVGISVFVAYAALACITTWPVVARITTHLPGDSTDALLHYWNGWWVQTALSEGRSPYYTLYLFYPDGLSLVTHNVAWFQIIPWIVLEPLLSGIPAYNISLLLNLSLCGCAAFILTWKLTDDARAAFVSGLIYQAWPYRLSQLDHPNLLGTQWVPIFFLFLIYTIRRGRWWHVVLAGLSFALVGYTRWQQLIAVTPMALTLFLCLAPRWWPKGHRYILLRLLAAACIAILALLPPAWLLLSHLRGSGDPVDLVREGEDAVMQPDVLAYLTPWDDHPVLGTWTGPLYARYYSGRPDTPDPAYIGFVALFLAFVGARSRGRRSLGWVLMAIVLILMALGPVLRVNGHLLTVPTFYGLLAPLLRLMRAPERFNMFLALPVAVLSAYGMAELGRKGRKHRPWTRHLCPVLLGGLAVFEYLGIPVPLQDVSSVPSFYAQIAQEPGDWAVMNYPSRNSKSYMFEQTFHQRPMLRGNISRLPERPSAYIDAHPRLDFLEQPHNLPPDEFDVSRLLASLDEDGIHYLILHKLRLGTRGVARWKRYLLADPRYEDDQVAVYVTRPEAGRDFDLKEELAPGLGPVEILVSAECLNPDLPFEVAVGWGSTQEMSEDRDVIISLVDGEGHTWHSERFPLSATWPTGQWPENALSWEFHALHLPSSIPAAEYDLRLAVSGPGQRGAMSVQPLTIQQQVCSLAALPEAEDLNARFGQEIRLLEYEIDQREGNLDLTLYWQTACRLDTDYKVFVHISDPATGIPLAQQDAMPCNWTYPTSRWWPAEIVEDRVSIPLDDIPAGRYEIAVGMYRPSDGERLPVVDGLGQLVADGRLVLDSARELE